jgi:transposase-like protein
MTQTKTTKVTHLRQRRVFSEGIRRSIVQDIEQGKCTVSQAGKELAVSNNTIYQWIYRYSRYLIKNRIMVVEDNSETYRSQELDKRIKDLEAALGRKQMEIDLLSKIIDLANKEYKTDLKKNLSKEPSKNSDSKKGPHTNTK